MRILCDQLARAHGQARRLLAARAGSMKLLSWGRKYLPHHFVRPASIMHRWLGRVSRQHVAQPRHEAQRARSPRRGQVDHRHARLPLAGRRRGARALHLDPLRHPPPGLRHLENLKAELVDNPRLAADYPSAVGRGPVWRAGAIVLRNGVSDRGLRHRPADPRPTPPRQPAHAHPLRRPAERRPHAVGPAAGTLAHLVPRHADEGRHAADQRGQPGHRPAPRGPGHGTPPNARLDLADLPGHRTLARQHVAVGSNGRQIYADLENPDARQAARRVLRASTAGAWTPARPSSGPRRRTSTR